MKKFKNLFAAVFVLFSATLFSQVTVSGTVIDDLGTPLLGAEITEKGRENGVSADMDGTFSFETKSNSGSLEVSFMGFKTKVIVFEKAGNLGQIQLDPEASMLDDVVITATSFAIGRKTPVAVSTIKAEDIQTKLGTQEFPEILKSTPGVYATKGTGGGYGDSRINLRGFSSENIAVMINGVPINDMEKGKVYWSNWAGLSDVTAAMQVQRGLGASKVAVPSIGGTINIITKSTDIKKGGSISTSIANNGYAKYGMTLSTGLMDNGLTVTVSGSKVSGEGYIDGAKFEGFNYFLNIAKRINDSHKLSFTGFGAQQKHASRYARKTIQFYKDLGDNRRRYNPDWGYRNGVKESTSENFYHKPQLSLNHDWNISDSVFVTTALYASFGSGGLKYDIGEDSGKYRFGGEDQPINFNKVIEKNIQNGIEGSETIFLGNMNSHKWYGILSTLKLDINEDLTFMGGIDARYYKGYHHKEVNDLLGGQYYIYNKGKSGEKVLKKGDHFQEDYIGFVKRAGVFAQLEYSKDDLSAFVSSSISNSNYSREEILNKEGMSESRNFIGFGNKGGVNYNIDEKHNVFGNIGYLSNAPFLRTSVFMNKTSNEFNENAVNEKVFSSELGYGLKTALFSANLNIYRTAWLDKSTIQTVDTQGSEREFINVEGLDALHQGVELDFVYNISDKLKFTGMASIGDWKWTSDAKGIHRDDAGNVLAEVEVNGKGLKVSDAAQTTFAAGLNYQPIRGTKFFVDYNYAGDNYASFNIVRSIDRKQSWKVPEYHLFDFGFKHGFKIGKFDTTVSGKLNNVLDTEYISDARDGGAHRAEDASVYYGAGRTFSLGLKVKF